MKRFVVVGLIVWSMVAVGFCPDAGAARGCRPATRRCCVGVTHQPCPPIAAVRAPQTREAVDVVNACVCAFFVFAQFPGYNMYYAIDYHPTCSTGYYASLDGHFDTSNNNPCPTCPTSQCIPYQYMASAPPTGRISKPGTKLERKLQWDEQLVLKSGTAKVKIGDRERTLEIEAKELADAKMLVSFSKGNTMYFAKLHVCRLESHEAGTSTAATVIDSAFGQEIDAPPSGQKIVDVSNQVTTVGKNIAQIRVGATVYQVITATPLSE